MQTSPCPCLCTGWEAPNWSHVCVFVARFVSFPTTATIEYQAMTMALPVRRDWLATEESEGTRTGSIAQNLTRRDWLATGESEGARTGSIAQNLIALAFRRRRLIRYLFSASLGVRAVAEEKMAARRRQCGDLLQTLNSVQTALCNSLL